MSAPGGKKAEQMAEAGERPDVPRGGTHPERATGKPGRTPGAEPATWETENRSRPPVPEEPMAPQELTARHAEVSCSWAVAEVRVLVPLS